MYGWTELGTKISMKNLWLAKAIILLYHNSTIQECKLNCTNNENCVVQINKANNITIRLYMGVLTLMQLHGKVLYFHVDTVSVCIFSFYFYCE